MAEDILSGERTAIIVGIDKYHDESIQELKGAENDAREIGNILKDFGKFKVKEGQNLLLGSNATCAKIRRAVSNIYYNSKGYDLILFYFSGHGLQDGFKNVYIAPYDISRNEPFTCGLSIRELNQVLSSYYDFYKSKKRTTVLTILDHCYSGAGTFTTKNIRASESEYVTDLKSLTGEGRIVFASSGEDQESREILDSTHGNKDVPHAHGVFTSNLIKGLEGEAADEYGIIQFDKLRTYVENQMINNKSQRTKFFAEQSQTADIRIAIISKKQLEFVNERIKKAEQLLQETANLKPYISEVAEAAKKIKEVLGREPTNNDANNIKQKIENFLNPYGDEMINWLETNIRPLRREIDKIDPGGGIYVKLCDLPFYLKFDNIIQIDRINLDLLEILYDVVNYKTTNTETVIRRIRSAITRNRVPEAASLGVEN